MRTSLLSTAATLLPLLVSGTSAATSTSLYCLTQLGPRSVARVPSGTTTITDSVRPTQFVTVKTTVTAFVPFTSTVTAITIETDTFTDTAITDTFSTTTTEYSVETDTNTATITTTSTSTITTSSTSTTISATTAGFKNIDDTMNSYNLPQKREPEHPHAVRALTSGTRGLQSLAAYPTKIVCTRTLPNTNTKTIYTTIRATHTIPYFAWRTTSVTTLTTTSTVVPADVSETLTYTSTSSVTTFTTTFVTTTQTTSTTTTSVIPGPTVWNACNQRNMWGPNFTNQGNNYFAVNVANNGPGVGSDFKIVADGAATPLDCCNACMAFGTCETWIFRQRNRNCFFAYHDGETCANQLNHPNYILSKSGSDTGSGYVVGNGMCGYTYSGNSDGSVFPVDNI